MKYALVNGNREEAQPDLAGSCSYCAAPMVAKCGEVRAWHWAHRGRRVCDPWWEDETAWHRAWKNQFPPNWQEVVHRAEDGERHIADVKTIDGWVLEFQHSHLDPVERRSREAFYQNLIWVVDGVRKKYDSAQFTKSLARGTSPNPFSNKWRIPSPAGALLRDWAGSSAHVFFDFADARELWWLFPGGNEERAYVQRVSRAEFIRSHRDTGLRHFESLVENFIAFVARYEPPPARPLPRPMAASRPLPYGLRPLRRRFRF